VAIDLIIAHPFAHILFGFRYDPGIPWGLEDWNYWLSTVPHNPVVRFIPETTFFYRHHTGTSMRKKMFGMYLEQTKAMVRTNHAQLYEPVQILHDHQTVKDMHQVCG
jgi:hypothetical protein